MKDFEFLDLDEFLDVADEVEHTDKLVHNIVLNSNGKKVQLTNFDIRVLLNILKEGNYMLLEETAFPIK